jgi:hypothetical protein
VDPELNISGPDTSFPSLRNSAPPKSGPILKKLQVTSKRYTVHNCAKTFKTFQRRILQIKLNVFSWTIYFARERLDLNPIGPKNYGSDRMWILWMTCVQRSFYTTHAICFTILNMNDSYIDFCLFAQSYNICAGAGGPLRYHY